MTFNSTLLATLWPNQFKLDSYSTSPFKHIGFSYSVEATYTFDRLAKSYLLCLHPLTRVSLSLFLVQVCHSAAHACEFKAVSPHALFLGP